MKALLFSPMTLLVASILTSGGNNTGSLGLGQPKLRKRQTFINHDVPNKGAVNNMDVAIADFIHSNSLSFSLTQ